MRVRSGTTRFGISAAAVLALGVSPMVAHAAPARGTFGQTATQTAPSAAAASAAQSPTATYAAPHLPLGPDSLPETRTSRTLQPGVTWTHIDRGEPDPALFWTVEISIPSGATSPDPDAPPSVLKDHESAQQTADDLAAAGFTARVEEVTTPAMADVPAHTEGWRVRVGHFASQAEANAERTRLRTAGFQGSAVYTGWDGDATDRGPWNVDVLTIDPKTFTGRLVSSVGPDIEQRETTSALAQFAGATAGTNAGFFVLDPRAGAPGDPAGISVLGGRLVSEPTNDRPVLVFRDDAKGAAVERLAWTGEVRAGGTSLPLDGLNRVPTLIRNCGGIGDKPTNAPLHDVTCTDPDEIVEFTGDYAPDHTPSGDGLQVTLDRRGFVTKVANERGAAVPDGGTVLQATGDLAPKLAAMAKVGERLQVGSDLRGGHGEAVRPNGHTFMVNGGPLLVRDGRVHITAQRDGMVHPDDPSWFYGWVTKRNPRTIAGVDPAGRLVLVTVDGRSTASLGLSITEAADVAKALGLRDAINLDGGGSTTMVIGSQVVNHPSDAAGERPVGDALLVLP